MPMIFFIDYSSPSFSSLRSEKFSRATFYQSNFSIDAMHDKIQSDTWHIWNGEMMLMEGSSYSSCRGMRFDKLSYSPLWRSMPSIQYLRHHSWDYGDEALLDRHAPMEGRPPGVTPSALVAHCSNIFIADFIISRERRRRSPAISGRISTRGRAISRHELHTRWCKISMRKHYEMPPSTPSSPGEIWRWAAMQVSCSSWRASSPTAKMISIFIIVRNDGARLRPILPERWSRIADKARDIITWLSICLAVRGGELACRSSLHAPAALYMLEAKAQQARYILGIVIYRSYIYGGRLHRPWRAKPILSYGYIISMYEMLHHLKYHFYYRLALPHSKLWGGRHQMLEMDWYRHRHHWGVAKHALRLMLMRPRWDMIAIPRHCCCVHTEDAL